MKGNACCTCVRERERDDQQPRARMHDTRRTLHDEFFYSAFAGSHQSQNAATAQATAFKPQQQQPPRSSWKAHHCLCVRTWNVHMSSQKIALHIFITLKIIISIRFSIRMQSDSHGTCTRARAPRRVWLLTYGVAQKSEHLWAPITTKTWRDPS